MGKLRHIIAKEIRHILRDSRSLMIAILMPILMTMLYGYAINLDIKNIRLAVIDYDHSAESRDLMGRFYNSGYFVPALAEVDARDPEHILQTGNAHAVLTIPDGLGEALQTGTAYDLGLMVDGADANVSAAAASYSNIILMTFLTQYMPANIMNSGIQLSQQVLYNPDLKSSHFFVPGLIAVILMMISALLTSITIAREKETGTMEQLLTAPIKPFQIIIGKVIPYIGLGVIDGLLVLVLGITVFGVPFNGHVVLLVLFGVIYIIAALALGVLISTLARTQQLAMMIAMVVTVLPSVMLSGFIFEIKNMPQLLQYVTYIVPAKYFLLIIRGIMLKGSGIAVLWPQAVALVVITIVLLGIASKKFKMRIG
jgi:ABC-2 type transport system permease protein